MTPIEHRLASLERTVNNLAKLLKKEKHQDDNWLSPEQVQKLYGYKPDTLRLWRRTGKLKDWTCSETGRKFRYSKKELDKKVFKPN